MSLRRGKRPFTRTPATPSSPSAPPAQTDRLQRVEGAVPRLLVRDAQVANLEPEGDVFSGGQPRQELVVLEDDPHAAPQLGDARRLDLMRRHACHPEPSARGPDLAVDQLQQGSLAGAAGAHQKGELARQQLEMNVIQGDASAIGSRDGGKLEDWAHFSVSGNGELQ